MPCALTKAGKLGQREKDMLNRLGFMVDAYHVKTYDWEVFDMIRKLILTSLLVVAFDGSAPHLAGSLLTTFIFLLLHLIKNPYHNAGLNNFQRLALITHFFTIFAGILYLMVDCLDDLHEAMPSKEAQEASNFWTLFIFGINGVVAILYPAYCFLLLFWEDLWGNLSEHASSMTRKCKKCLEDFRSGPPPEY